MTLEQSKIQRSQGESFGSEGLTSFGAFPTPSRAWCLAQGHSGIPAIGETQTIHNNLPFFVQRYTVSAQWFRYAAPGGLKFPDGSGGKFEAQEPERQLRALFLVPFLLDDVRVLGGSGIDALRDIGSAMQRVGVRPIADASGQRSSGRHGANRFESLGRGGIELADGTRLSLPEELVAKVSGIHAGVQNAARWLTQFSPQERLRSQMTYASTSLPKANNLDLVAVYTLAYFLGGLSEGRYQSFRSTVPEQAINMPSLFQVLSPHELGIAATALYAKGWHFRKNVEPGGTSHSSFEHFQAFRSAPERDRLFIPLLNIGHLRDLALIGAPALVSLASAGRQIVERGYDLQVGEFVNPLDGVPVLADPERGARVLLASELLDARACTRHSRWCFSRRILAGVPDGNLRPLPRHEDRLWDVNAPRDPKVWNPDRVNVYGDAISLAFLKLQRPEIWRKFLEIARRPLESSA